MRLAVILVVTSFLAVGISEPPSFNQNQQYGAPQQQQSYNAPQQSYGSPQQQQQSYGAPQQQQQSYDAPQQQSYGPPGYTPGQPLGPSSSQECPPNNPEMNKAFVMRAYQTVFGDKNADNVEEFFHTDYIQHNPMAPDGIDAVRMLVKMLPDPPQTIDFKRVSAEGDLVWTHARAMFFGHTFAVVDIFRIECGRIKEHWDVMQDINALMMPAANSHPFF